MISPYTINIPDERLAAIRAKVEAYDWSQLPDLVCADAVFSMKIPGFIGYSSTTRALLVHYLFEHLY